jgi:polyphosphate kinase
MTDYRYVNRDLSWLRFNGRVLQEAEDQSVPLIERIRFLGIFSNNLDEFFRVRYASIQRLSRLSVKKAKEQLGGWEPEPLMLAINAVVAQQQARSEAIYKDLMVELEAQGISIIDETHLTQGQKDFVRKFYIDKVSPSVFVVLPQDHKPFPELKDKSIYLAIRLVPKGEVTTPIYSLIELPSDLIGRFVVLPKYGRQYLMYLDDVIRYNLQYAYFIFPSERIEAHTVKITRDAELDLDNDISKTTLEKVQQGLAFREVGDPVRLVYDREIDPEFLDYLSQKLRIEAIDSLLPGGRYHNKKDLIKFPNVGGPELEHPRLEPLAHPDLNLDRSILNVVRQKDVLIFSPYHNFSYIIRFLREAAMDPAVTRIAMTLYRLADQSRVVSALINAAKNGKKVRVIIELQARFDEENNIHYTEKMRQEGIEVLSGVPGLKVHSKVVLVERRVGADKLERFAVVGTGNFHEGTARFYTDYHVMTADKRITKEVVDVFDFILAPYTVRKFKHLLVSPQFTRKGIEQRIDREIKHAKAGKSASLFFKFNSLSSYDFCEKLYEASQAGVKIRLIVRGICCLIPGVKGMSENIEAISIVDRYLEHSRVYWFENDGDPECYLASFDLMTRNLDYRVEVGVPIYSPAVQREIRDHMEILWKDNVKARLHGENVESVYRKAVGPRVRGQMALRDYVQNQLKKGQNP